MFVRNNGFTLVELSIVIIIIGLVTGGVLGGQSLIASGKRQALINDFQSLTTSVKAYNLEFDAIPGDHNEATSYFPSDPNVNNGNGDGLVGTGINGTARSLELSNVFFHMNAAGITNYDFHDEVVSSLTMARNDYHAEAKIGYSYNSTYGGHIVGFTRYQAEQSNNLYKTNGGIMTPAEGKKIDKKIDDGEGSYGKFFGVRSYGRGVSWSHCATSYTGGGKINGDWRVTQDTITGCAVVLRDH